MNFNLVVLAGGKGERLWPISTLDQPKQFFKFFDQSSLFQETLKRNQKLFSQIYVLSHEKYFFTVTDQLESLNLNGKLFLEPLNKGTLPSLVLALLEMNPDDLFFMTPADLKISQEVCYENFLSELIQNQLDQEITLLGKEPSEPSSSYGYICHELGKVLKFIEKPHKEKAALLIDEGSVLWNCGMILSKVSTFLSLVQDVDPLYLHQCREIFLNRKSNVLFKNLFRFDPEAFAQLDSKTIDYAVLENATNLKVASVPFDWQDLGSFQSIKQAKLTANNLILFNSSNVKAEGVHKDIFVQNLNDIAIIEKDDQIFILKR